MTTEYKSVHPPAHAPATPALHTGAATIPGRYAAAFMAGDRGGNGSAGRAAAIWAFAWAGGLALARYLLDHPGEVAGKRVLDFATGSGLCAIAALRAGAAAGAWRRILIRSAPPPWRSTRRPTAPREEGGKPVATIVGEGDKYPARAAALANGTISHALDYDDTHFAHIGHLSVGIYPAALAVGEETNASAIETRDAFLTGAEAACRIGWYWAGSIINVVSIRRQPRELLGPPSPPGGCIA